MDKFNLTPIIPWVGLAAIVVNVAEDPLAIGLLGAVGIMVVTEDLFDLIHQSEFGIRSKFWLAFHVRYDYIVISGKNQPKGNKWP
jgi:hypothetical protein